PTDTCFPSVISIVTVPTHLVAFELVSVGIMVCCPFFTFDVSFFTSRITFNISTRSSASFPVSSFMISSGFIYFLLFFFSCLKSRLLLQSHRTIFLLFCYKPLRLHLHTKNIPSEYFSYLTLCVTPSSYFSYANI